MTTPVQALQAPLPVQADNDPIRVGPDKHWCPGAASSGGLL